MKKSEVKEEAKKIIDNLKEDATWDDLLDQIYRRQYGERGEDLRRSGRTIEVNELRNRKENNG